MTSFDQLMVTIGQLAAQAEALGALGASLGARVGTADADDAARATLDDVARALGVDPEALTLEQARAGAGFARVFLALALDIVDQPGRGGGWVHEDPAILQSIGQGSAVIAGVIAAVAPELDGLEEALFRPGAAFLDVGAGVAALSLALARAFPDAKIVSLEPWAPSMALARANVAAADVGDRVELRAVTVQGLGDRAVYDGAFLPLPFIAPASVPEVLAATRAALRPGGWAFAGLFAGPDDPVAQRLMDLRTLRSGGWPWSQDELVGLLEGAGLVDVRALARTWQVPVRFVVGRRDPEETA